MMGPERISAQLEDIISRLDMLAGWLGDPLGGDIQACVEVALAAETSHTLRLEIEREQFARVAA
jgi:hypothetical protein